MGMENEVMIWSCGLLIGDIIRPFSPKGTTSPTFTSSTMTPNPTPRMTPEIAIPLRDAFLKGVNQNNRGPRKKGRYSKEEKAVLNKYKHDYRKTTTTEERFDLLRNRILVDIFNFWYAKGEVTPNIEPDVLSEKIKVMSKDFMN